MENNLPNFLIVGVAKSGTTSLFYYLNQHPDIFIPPRKEGRFFSQMPGNFEGPGADYQNDVIQTIGEYRKLYSGTENVTARGDVSNDYLFYYQRSIENIKTYLGEVVKIIIILRNPIDRAYSNYLHLVRDGWENLSFEDALQAEDSRKKKNWAWPFFYKEVGLYYEQVKAYLSNFRNVRFFLFEDLFQAKTMLKGLLTFIGVSSDFQPNTKTKYNITGVPKRKLLHRFLNKASKLKPVIIPMVGLFVPREKLQQMMSKIKAQNLRNVPMNPSTREYLKKYFREDIENLSILIDRNLESWLS